MMLKHKMNRLIEYQKKVYKNKNEMVTHLFKYHDMITLLIKILHLVWQNVLQNKLSLHVKAACTYMHGKKVMSNG